MNTEINKFNELANHWWDTQGPLKPLHAINPLRFKFIQAKVDLTGKRVLDVGCGGGILTESLAKSGALASGLDLAADVIAIAREHAKAQHLDIEYHCLPIETFATQQAHTFDVITCMEMLEHVPDPTLIIQSCAQLLKPGGVLFLSTLNRNFKSFLLAIIGAEYLSNLVPKGTHEYAKFIKPSEISRVLREQGFEVDKIQGMQYHPLKQTFSLGADCDVSYLMSATYCE
ncbi:MAG: bifunctional 2-polyprenyl-6-hydroxyphenol methylase/3-demethylubiquinol 3-O-methyltransferase UbiG [Gammaproteobacteria bacterium]|jgi:2-polyprenyl-6-hydroxyphenyl methylase/3-demethylubiquinone-9 3-methyltransferase